MTAIAIIIAILAVFACRENDGRIAALEERLREED
jgi:hypothetical protein